MIGSGPAGLSCAGELARRGHSVTVFEKRDLAGGLSTYGIIALREPVEARWRKCAMIERLGVRIETGVELGRNLDARRSASALRRGLSGVGLGATPAMGIPGEEHILDGLAYIEQSKLNPRRPEDRPQRGGDRRGQYGDRLRHHREAAGRGAA